MLLKYCQDSHKVARGPLGGQAKEPLGGYQFHYKRYQKVITCWDSL